MPTCISEPATLAAGPDSIVMAGRCRISLMPITPPSPRMIISGASIPAFFMLVSVRLAVAIIRGRIDALITAVRVRIVSPYSRVTSCPQVVGRPNPSPTSRTSSSVEVLSTPNAADATSTWAPSARSAATAFSTAFRSSPPVAEQELIAGLKHAARREFDRIDAHLHLGEFRCLGGRQAQDSDPRHVALQQRVGGLRRAVGEKDDVAGIDAGIAQDLLEHLDDARSDAVRMVMGGMNRRTPCDAAVDVIDQGGFCESSSYVDSDAIGFFAQDFVHSPSGPPETTH